MPPRAVKRGGSAGKKTVARGARGKAAAAAAAAQAGDEAVKAEQVTVTERKEEVKVEEIKIKEAVQKKEPENKPEIEKSNGSDAQGKG